MSLSVSLLCHLICRVSCRRRSFRLCPSVSVPLPLPLIFSSVSPRRPVCRPASSVNLRDECRHRSSPYSVPPATGPATEPSPAPRRRARIPRDLPSLTYMTFPCRCPFVPICRPRRGGLSQRPESGRSRPPAAVRLGARAPPPTHGPRRGGRAPRPRVPSRDSSARCAAPSEASTARLSVRVLVCLLRIYFPQPTRLSRRASPHSAAARGPQRSRRSRGRSTGRSVWPL